MTRYVLSLSYGKDSIACLQAIKELGLPLDRIVHAEVWATDDIPADLPPMVEFKAYADKIIKERYGIEVEHVCATKNGEKITYEKLFYHIPKRSSERRLPGSILGFPQIRGQWCQSQLKLSAIRTALRDEATNTMQYLGIAADEAERIAQHENRKNVILPLVMAGYDEHRCRSWCENNQLLSPIYSGSYRGGCWFCHNQNMQQLRLLRKNYPELWDLMLKWDKDSPVTFKPDGRTVHDIDKRISLEKAGLIPKDRRFRWSMIDGPCCWQMNFDNLLGGKI